jgi:hypothetical protein
MDAYRLAIDQARTELAESQQKLKALTLRVSQLESVVTQLEALTAMGIIPAPSSQFELPKPSVPLAPPATASPVKVPEVQPPLWKAVINALNGKKGDFTVPDALAALERTGRRIGSPNRLNIIRNTLIQNKAFGRLGTGHYYVVGYEETGAPINEKEAPKGTS